MPEKKVEIGEDGELIPDEDEIDEDELKQMLKP